MSDFPWNTRIVIMGAGDRGTAAALRLFHSGFHPLMLELSQPTDLHFNRTFSDVIYCERKTVEKVEAVAVVPSADETVLNKQIQECLDNRQVPVINKQDFKENEIVSTLHPEILIDCSRKISKTPDAEFVWHMIPCVIRIGFAQTVGVDGHYVIGDVQSYCGMVFNTRQQIPLENHAADSIFKSPLAGIFQTEKRIGDPVQEREVIGKLNDINIMAPYTGYITGLLHSGHFVSARQPLFELLRYQKSRELLSILPVNCRAIAGGILEAVLNFLSAKL